MVTNFEFPDVGEGVTEGTLIAWLVEEGDEVEEDESLAEVETDKAVVEVPSPTDGTVLKLHAEEGDTIKVGEVIVSIGEEGEEVDVEAGEEEARGEDEEEQESSGSTSVVGVLEEAPDEEPGDEEEERETPSERSEQKSTKKVLATPSTRRLAREKDVDVSGIEGTGPGGRITREDVLQAAGESPPGPSGEHTETPEDTGGRRFEPREYDFSRYGDVERQEMSGTRRAIARNMERSKYTAPHVTSTDDADVTELWDLRKKEKEVAEEKGVHLTFLPFIVKALISALKEYPRMNSSLDEKTGEIVLKKYYNIGVAVATDDGLLVPNIKEAEEKGILDLAEEMEDLSEKARNRDLSLEEMKGGTFTITNYGSIGGVYGTPILNYPEVGILGVGTIQEKPVVRDGEVVPRKVMPLSVSFDHRVVDGAYVAEFMNELVKHLEDPDLLLLE